MIAALASIAAQLGMVDAATAEVTYDICIRTQDVSEAGTDDDIYVTLTGANGSTAEMRLDNPDRDDLNRNTWTCYTRSVLEPGMEDVGHVNEMKLEIKGKDDVCYRQQYVRRNVDGKEVSISQFPGRGCLGDDAQFRNATLKAENPSYVRGKPQGKWYSLGSGASASQATVTSGVTIANSKKESLSRQEVNSITVAMSNETEMKGFGKVKASVSGTKSLAVTSATEVMNSHSLNQKNTCSGTFENQKNNLGYVWQWGVETYIGNELLVVRTCHFACTDDYVAPTNPLGDPSIKFCY